MAEKSTAVPVAIEDLRLAFGKTEVLKGVSLKIEPGELFAFLGPSGSGKSTLLRAIAGFGPVPDGRIVIGGDDVTRLPPWQRNVGMVFQSYALWPHMTVYRNVAFGLEERKVPPAEIKRRVHAALDLVGLLDYAARRPSQLSGGQQQRVALARTIVVEPRVLLLDEPLSNLDANLRVQMRREILELQRALHITTIFVTHDQEEANTISERMAVLADGSIQQVGSPLELYDRPNSRFVAQFLGTVNLIDGRVEEANGAMVFRSEDGITIALPPRGKAIAGRCSAMFRPQNLTISAAGTGARASGGFALSGRVRQREFLGGLVRYGVQVGNQMIQVDDPHQAGRAVLSAGDEVALNLDLAQVRLLTT